REATTADEHAASRFGFGDCSLEAGHGRFADYRTEVYVARERVANHDRAGPFNERVDERFVQRPFDVRARCSRALLALEPERRAHCSFRRRVNLGRRRDNDRVLPTHFADDWFWVRGSERTV